MKRVTGLTLVPAGIQGAALAGAVLVAAAQLRCSGSDATSPTVVKSDTPVSGGSGTVAATNAPPRIVWRTTPAADRSTSPPTVAGRAPLTVHFRSQLLARVMQAELKRSDARMAEHQGTNETLSAELQAVRERLSGMETMNAQLLRLASALEELKAKLNQARQFPRMARTIQ